MRGRSILVAAAGASFGLLGAWCLIVFQPWHNRSLTWSLLGVSSSRVVSAPGTRWPAWSPEVTERLESFFPVGTSGESAVRELEANGFACRRDFDEHETVDCRRDFGPVVPFLPVSRSWMVVIVLDQDRRVAKLLGAKHTDGP